MPRQLTVFEFMKPAKQVVFPYVLQKPKGYIKRRITFVKNGHDGHTPGQYRGRIQNLGCNEFGESCGAGFTGVWVTHYPPRAKPGLFDFVHVYAKEILHISR